MGGRGSTRWGNYQKKETVESSRILDVHIILKDRVLKRISSVESVSLVIRSITNKNGAHFVSCGIFDDRVSIGCRGIRIPLARTTIPFRGTRWWFRCRMVKGEIICGRRVKRLYQPISSRDFGCRKCHNLTYQSCQESHILRKLKNI